jgi:hypothetical protein
VYLYVSVYQHVQSASEQGEGYCVTCLYVARMGKKRIAFWDLAGKAEGKRRLEDLTLDGGNFKACIKQMEWDGMEWINLAKDSDSCGGLLRRR